MVRVGLTTWPRSTQGLIGGLSIQDTLRTVKLAEKKGFESVWVQEGHRRDAVSIIGALAAITKRIRIGTGIISVFYRTPTLIAMTTATLDEISGGRAFLGLGTGHKLIVTNWHGVEFTDPLLRLKEYVEVIRRILSGQTVTYEGNVVQIRNYKLGFEPIKTNIPIYVAALGLRSARLAGEVGDGAILSINTVNRVKQLVREIKSSAKRAGRDPSDLDLGCFLTMCISEDVDNAIKSSKKTIAYFTSLPFYYRAFVEMGFKKEAEQIKLAWEKGDSKDAAQRVTDTMVRNLTIVGTPEECRSRVEDYRVAGVKLPVIWALPFVEDYKANLIELIKTFST